MSKVGKLYVVATPLGNLEDMTLRAVRVLKEVDLVAAEDTRHSRKLLDHFGISKRLFSYYDQVEERKAGALVRAMQMGRNVALISDAGTPCIADPGFRLVRAAVAAEIPVEVVPGPSAVVAALSVSGLPTDRFCFEGFVPARAAARERFLAALAPEPRTIVLYEAGRRLGETLAAIAAAFGEDRPVVACRELTKLHEEVVRGTAGELRDRLQEAPVPVRGELVLVIGGATARARPLSEEEIVAGLVELRERGMSLKQAAQQLAVEHGLGRNEVYRIGLAHAVRGAGL